ncbi:unnamed protein product [Nezara viridula]|uniref:Uncharacterized protein n=1 Tax=Nezara viridula TaxID=85310 RepID=A0A9P0HJD9_NEZVI|nr:unnamed protein product [Nezara viridula]
MHILITFALCHLDLCCFFVFFHGRYVTGTLNLLLLIRKEYAESHPNEVKYSSGSELSCRYSDSKSCSEKPQRKNTQSVVNKWYKTRVVKYKIASEFAAELRLAILIAIQNTATAQSVLAMSSNFSMLEEKRHWFRSQIHTLRNNIKQLAMSSHLLRAELNSDQFADHCINLTEKKMKPKLKRKKVIKRTL